MTAQRNHYEVLGVPATATTTQIKTKYREMARMFHPDVAKDKALGQKMFTQINQAYRTLGDPERRAQYDSLLRLGGGPNGSPIASNGTAGAAGAAQKNGTAPTNGTANGARAAADPMAVTRLVGDADFALMNGDAAGAQAHCEAALRLDPQNAKGLGLLGDALAAQGKREEAAAAYRRSLQAAPSPMVQAKLSRLDNGGGTPTLPPGGGGAPRTAPQNGNGAARPSAAGAKPSGGLFGLFPGKKK